MSKLGIVYIVHCIDTEGCLYESLKETFLRIERFTGKKITPSVENLRRIQNVTYSKNYECIKYNCHNNR